MRLVPKRWHNETWICSIKGHYVPAATAARLTDADRSLASDVGDGTRYSRCLRCDLWVRGPIPEAEQAAYDVVPPLAELDLPRRGKPLQDAIFMRLIALDRLVHGCIFGIIAISLILIQLNLPRIKDWANSLIESLQGAVDTTGRAASHDVLARRLASLADLNSGELRILMITAIAYAVIETTEGIYLWKERRWAEYLTVIATVGFIPFEVKELLSKVSFLRVTALVVNVLILIWLVWNKRLFGINGGAAALEDNIDWDTILADPLSPATTPVEK